MDPQSLAFTPNQNNDVWRLSTAMKTLQETQQEHADRLLRLERQRDDDARMKSVWGPASPFPGVLSGTSQHGMLRRLNLPDTATNKTFKGPVHTTVDFANFDDDQSNSMVRSLHLDADEEPRRFGASRANSVRFDDSAKPGQWGHASRSSVDLPSRAGSSWGPLGGGHTLFERSQSHKSDGKSSIGQAAASSRANSLMLDTSSQPYTPAAEEPPSLAPGLLLLGSVPSIIRCWLTDNFKHDTLLYAAICTGSYKSYLDSRMIDMLGLSRQVCQDLSGDRKIKLSVYLPEAVPLPASSRSSTPSSQLPLISVDFTVMERSTKHIDSKAIQIFIGSDTLRAHSCDVLFSSNTVTMFDDDRTKLSIPLVRPENDETFKGLFCTTSTPTSSRSRPGLTHDARSESYDLPNGDENLPPHSTLPTPAAAPEHVQPQRHIDDSSPHTASSRPVPARDSDATPIPQQPQPPQKHDRVTFDPITTSSEPPRDTTTDDSPPSATTPLTARTPSSLATWGSWRRDGAAAGTSDPSSSLRNGIGGSLSRPNRDQGIKVLKPARTISRGTGNGTASPLPASPGGGGQSRFFDDGKRRGGGDVGESTGQGLPPQARRSLSGDSARGMALGRDSGRDTREYAAANAAAPKPSRVNPIGGASAFGWLNSGAK